MNTLRTGQTEVGGSNESGQTDIRGESSEGEETDDARNTRVMPLTLKTTQMLSFLLLSPPDEEYVDERPAATRSGRAVTRRAEIDFWFFWVKII